MGFLLPALLPLHLSNNHSPTTELLNCHSLKMPRPTSTLDLTHPAQITCQDTPARTGGKAKLLVFRDKPVDSEITQPFTQPHEQFEQCEEVGILYPIRLSNSLII